LYEYLVSFWEASMLGHGAGISYMGLGPRMVPTDNFSLVTGPLFASVAGSSRVSGHLTDHVTLGSRQCRRYNCRRR